jgi:T5SS/PEP-CTERM-associated repeat protein
MNSVSPAPRRARLAPLALATLSLLGLAPAHDAAAAERWWTFIGGCRTADWFRVVDGPNSQGQNNCWAASSGGLSGQLAPTASDDAYIALPNAIATTLVNFADASRSGLTGRARSLTMYGSTSAASGLNVERLTLNIGNDLTLGLSSGNRALMQHSGGTVSVGGTTTLLNSEYRLSGGSFASGVLSVGGSTAGSRFALSGGTFNATQVQLGSSGAAEARYEQTGGRADVGLFAVGTFSTTRPAQATVSGGSSFFNNSGNTLVGYLGSGTMAVSAGVRASSGNTVIGSSDGIDGLLTVDGTGTFWTNSGGTAVGQVGTGRLIVTGGAVYRTATLETNTAPELFGGALGAAVEVGGLDSRVEVSGAVTTGVMSRSRFLVRDRGTLTAASLSLGTDKRYRGNADVTTQGELIVTGAMNVGDEGVAVLRGSGGAQIRSGATVLSRASTARGVVELDGAQTQWVVNGDLSIAVGASAYVQLGGGAWLQSGSTGIGQGSGAAGEMLLSGNGTRWTAWSGFSVSVLGSGSLSATDGARVDSGGLVRAAIGGSGAGVLNFAGAGTRWDHSGELQLGVAGPARLDVSGGAFAQMNGPVTMAVQASSNGTLVVSGIGSSMHSTGTLGVGSRGSAEASFLAGASGRAASLIVAEHVSATGDLILQGAGTQLVVGDTVTIGRGGVASLTVGSGAQLQSRAATLAQTQSGRALVRVTSPGSRWTLQGGLTIGEVGYASLTIGPGAVVQASGLTRVGSAASELVLDGGTLQSGQMAIGAPGQLDWRSGTLHVTGVPGAALDDSALPAFVRLGATRTLRVDQTLTLPRASVLLLAGGTLEAGTLLLEDGLLASVAGGDHALAMGGIGEFAGRGQAQVRIQGGVGQANRIRAIGDLSLGIASRTDGFDFGGWLDVGSHQVVLLDRDAAALGHLTTLGSGGQLVTANGAALGSGDTLRSTGFADVFGALRNDGTVRADPLDGRGALDLHGPVSGTGKFFGNVNFLAGFDPGNSTAVVEFGGGDVGFGEHAILTLELNGTAPGAGFDRLVDIGTLTFAGSLRLAFGAGFYALPGERVDVLDFGSLLGGFAPDRIVVAGIERDRLDFSRLAIDGSLGFVGQVGMPPPPVPEPGAAVLMLMGLGALLARRRGIVRG